MLLRAMPSARRFATGSDGNKRKALRAFARQHALHTVKPKGSKKINYLCCREIIALKAGQALPRLAYT
jgi:hypothetical protein